MINVAWGNEYMPTMLDTLDARKCEGDFFSWMESG